jgi:hypothetical protein
VDLIRSGKVPEVILRNGAAGNLPLPTEEKIEVLGFLATLPDRGLRETALETLRAWDESDILRLMASPQTSREVLSLVADHLAPGREDLQAVLLWNPRLPAESRSRLLLAIAANSADAEIATAPPVEQLPQPAPPPSMPEIPEESPAVFESQSIAEAVHESQSGPEAVPISDDDSVEILAKLVAGAKIEDVLGNNVEAPPEATMRDDELTSRDRETLIVKIGRMTVVEKIKAALTGNMETRALLIRDSNKIISRAVLQSPKISETEAEGYAAAKNVSEEVLRLIAANRKFRKVYTVIRALVNNPRAPIDVTMPLMIRINERDLKGLTLNRNVPEVIRSLAIKMIKQREDAGKVKLFNK